MAEASSSVAQLCSSRHALGMLDIFAPESSIVRVHAQILDIKPNISRVLELPMKLNFAELHEVLQAAFGWTDSHLHQFVVGGLTYGAPEFDKDGFSERRTFEATEVRMCDLLFPYGAEDDSLTIIYEYDFGDNWRHQLRLERRPREEGAIYPRCIAGSRSGPPEDVGGPFGYADFLDAWSDTSHENHKAMRAWAGRKFQPERCDLEVINKAITKAVRASQGDYRFRHERSD